MTDRGTLKPKESHPAIDSALRYIASLSMNELAIKQEAFSSCAIEGNRLAEICSETLRRLMNNEGVTDRYLLGLVETMRCSIDD